MRFSYDDTTRKAEISGLSFDEYVELCRHLQSTRDRSESSLDDALRPAGTPKSQEHRVLEDVASQSQGELTVTHEIGGKPVLVSTESAPVGLPVPTATDDSEAMEVLGAYADLLKSVSTTDEPAEVFSLDAIRKRAEAGTQEVLEHAAKLLTSATDQESFEWPRFADPSDPRPDEVKYAELQKHLRETWTAQGTFRGYKIEELGFFAGTRVAASYAPIDVVCWMRLEGNVGVWVDWQGNVLRAGPWDSFDTKDVDPGAPPGLGLSHPLPITTSNSLIVRHVVQDILAANPLDGDPFKHTEHIARLFLQAVPYVEVWREDMSGFTHESATVAALGVMRSQGLVTEDQYVNYCLGKHSRARSS